MRIELLKLLYPTDHGIPADIFRDEAAAYVDDPANARAFPVSAQGREDKIIYLYNLRAAQIRAAESALQDRERTAEDEAHKQHLADCAAAYKPEDINFRVNWRGQRVYQAQQLEEQARAPFEEQERRRQAEQVRQREAEAEQLARAAVEAELERRAKIAAAEKAARAALRSGAEELAAQGPTFWRTLAANLGA